MSVSTRAAQLFIAGLKNVFAASTVTRPQSRLVSHGTMGRRRFENAKYQF